ncbi:MAG: endonuclease Q family protein [Candidatus Helarchaeota archaeon]
MLINIDLHYHSGYSGGVGQIQLRNFLETGPKKGIDVFGTGDCLHSIWLKTLQNQLVETENDSGIFYLGKNKNVKFILQTELIFTCAIGKKRKSAHILFLFPSFSSISRILKLFKKWGVKNTIGRPFVICKDNEDVGDKLNKIVDVDEFIEFIPAHVMTPEGVFGPKNPINYLEEFFGNATDKINIVETGLSADPFILGLIPELDKIGLISNSDAHSTWLNRCGREFTTLEIKNSDFSYSEIIQLFRNKSIIRTCEFNPTESKFFLTGHRAGKAKHGKDYCVYSPGYTKKNKKCPICGKKLTIGVLERALELTKIQGANRKFGFLPLKKQKFIHMVPLIEIIAYHNNIKSVTSKRIIKVYDQIIELIGNECEMWFLENSVIREKLENNISPELIDLIIEIKKGNFSFSPIGFDGTYGKLLVGKKEDFFNVNFCSKKQYQKKLI